MFILGSNFVVSQCQLTNVTTTWTTLYSGNLTGESVMHWLQEQKMESQIRQVTGQMMRGLVESEEYVVAMFLKDCDRSDTCDEIVAELEEVNDELDKLGIPFVYTDDKAHIAKLKLDAVPMIGMFRNGELLQFDGSIENRMAVLKFATDLENLLLPGKIEEVSVPLLGGNSIETFFA